MPKKRKPTRPTRYRDASIGPSPDGTWLVTLHRGGKRYRKRQKSLDGAKQWIDELLDDLHVGARAMSAAERFDAVAALELGAGAVTLTEAMRYYMAHHTAAHSTLTVEAAAEEFLAEKQSLDLRPRAYASIRIHTQRFTRDYPETILSGIGAGDLVNWLNNMGVGATTRNNYRRSLRDFFGWAQRRGYIAADPTLGVPSARMDEKLPSVLSIDQTEALLRACVEHAPQLVAYHALGLFAGLRPAELERLEWPAVLSEQIHVGPGVAKTRQQRWVTKSANLINWLETCPQEQPLAPRNLQDNLKWIRRKVAGIDPWPEDVMRHSFATYHLALHRDAGLTAHELGHQSPAMLYRHYRNAADFDTATRFFEVRP